MVTFRAATLVKTATRTTSRTRPQRNVTVNVAFDMYKGSPRLVAVDANGKRIKNGNFVKIVPDLGVYLYKTISEAFGLPLDSEGRLVLLDENPHSS